ncbi:hypothetical protein PTKIN_Ptkin09bG0282400 [Pterospermum kingtungense]
MKEVKEWLDVEPTVPIFPSLKVLEIADCGKLNSLPMMSRFSSLERLTIDFCNELSWTDGCSSLSSLRLDGCQGLTSLPNGLINSTSLQYLDIYNFTNINSIPEDVDYLCIRRCQNLKRLPEESLGYLMHLKRLELGPFSEELVEFLGLNSLHHLEETSRGEPRLSAMPTSTPHST